MRRKIGKQSRSGHGRRRERRNSVPDTGKLALPDHGAPVFVLPLPALPDGLTLAFRPPADSAGSLPEIRVQFGSMSDYEMRVSMQASATARRHDPQQVTLTPEERREATLAGFQSHVPIFLTGRLTPGGMNIVAINGEARRVGSKHFPLLMRLLCALFETDNGYVPRGTLRGGGGLADEEYYTSDAMDQVNRRLRERLGSRELVEVSGGQIRISTHRRFVTFDHERLRLHPDERVRTLSERIRTSSSIPRPTQLPAGFEWWRSLLAARTRTDSFQSRLAEWAKANSTKPAA